MIQYGPYGETEPETAGRRLGKVLAIMLIIGLALLCRPELGSAASLLRVAGFVDVVPASLSLPLPHGATPVTIHVQLGSPTISIPVQVTPSTLIVNEGGLPVTLTDGDRVQVDAVIVNGNIRAATLVVDEFPEVAVRGAAAGLPAGGVTLPLPTGHTVSFHVTLVTGVDLALVVTDKTKLRKPGNLSNGETVTAAAVVVNGHLVVTEIAFPAD